jgi:hypothetical protein
MIEVYRFAKVKNQLPKHWALTDIEIDGASINPGFQVWESLNQVVGVSLGIDPMYGEAFMEYPYILIIEASSYYEAEGEWIAVEVENVESVKAVETGELTEWVKKELKIKEYWELEEKEIELNSWIKEKASTVQPIFVETLRK